MTLNSSTHTIRTKMAETVHHSIYDTYILIGSVIYTLELMNIYACICDIDILKLSG